MALTIDIETSLALLCTELWALAQSKGSITSATDIMQERVQEWLVARALVPLVETTTAGAGERERFEAWAKTILGDAPTWRESGDCELAWQAWQAWQARAALPAAQSEQDRICAASMLVQFPNGWT